MIEKRRNGTPNAALVTFRLPDGLTAERAHVVGEFNDWSPDADPMTNVDGTFEARLELPVGRTYRFRYLLDGETWDNDWAADAYHPNEYGGDDSVLDLTDVTELPVEPAPEKPGPRRRRKKETA